MRACQKGALLDATEDGEGGKNVFIKRVDRRTHPHEIKIASCLGSAESHRDRRNHCVPILTVFSDDQDPWYQYIVMPILRPFNEPNFTSFGEVADFVNQTLEVRLFAISSFSMLNVSHRVSCISTNKMWHIGEWPWRFWWTTGDGECSDCAAENILMDGSNLYKDDWHPMNTWLARDARDNLRLSRNRSEVEIKYYFIDFGLSTQFIPGQREPLVTGELGRIQAPEQIPGSPYDPFKLDVYYLGHVYQTKIVDVRFTYLLITSRANLCQQEFKGLEVLRDLARLMTKPNPRDRPSAHETLTIWNSLQLLPSIPPGWTRLRPTREEGSIERIMNNALDVVDMVRGSMGL